MERLLDEVLVGQQEMTGAIDAVCSQASRIIARLQEGAGFIDPVLLGTGGAPGTARAPTPAMKRYAESLARQKGISPPRGYATSSALCRAFLDQHASGKGAVPTAERDSNSPPALVEHPASAPKARKGGAWKTASRKVGAGRSKPPVATTRSKAGVAPAIPDGGAEETPLKIPFGNKDVALQLGARYRTGGWYAPAGLDLGGFRERGWL
jgi:DNA topoisomerase-3